MTREVAIKAIQDFIGWFKEDSLIRKALEMAIQALSQEPCDDAIRREDAEQMFRNIRSHLKPQDYKSAEEFNTRDLMLLNAEQMIHALPSVTQKSGKWIPVSKRLPTKEEYITNNGLFIVSDGNRTYAEYFDVYNSMKYFGEPTMSGFRVDKCVIAWMPLPEPYRAESEET